MKDKYSSLKVNFSCYLLKYFLYASLHAQLCTLGEKGNRFPL